MPILYLASPYSHPSALRRNDRVAQASLVAGYFMQLGFTIYSPITHGHRIAGTLPQSLKDSHEFWMSQCLPILGLSDALLLLPLHGWRESQGLQRELAYCKENRIPVFLLNNPDYFAFDSTLCDFPSDAEIKSSGWSLTEALPSA